MRTRTAHHGDHQVSRAETLDSGAGLDHFSQRFVPQYQELGAFGRRAVIEVADFAIRTANADFENSQFHLSR